ncbi:hypothetical protein YC2023_108594 [Brassica napus]
MGCLVSTHRTSVGVRQYTHDVLGCLCVSVYVHLCPSAHTGRLCLSISTHISTLVHGLSMLALPVDCLGRLWLTVAVRQHTHDVRGCLYVFVMSVSTHRTSVCVRQHTHDAVAVRVCPYVSVSTHRTSVAVHQYTTTRKQRDSDGQNRRKFVGKGLFRRISDEGVRRYHFVGKKEFVGISSEFPTTF